MVDDDGIPARAPVVRPANAVGELGLGIGQEQLQQLIVSIINTQNKYQATYNIVALDLVGLAPRTHHIGVIRRNHRDDLHALLTQLRQVLDIPGHMVHGAGRSERAWTISIPHIPIDQKWHSLPGTENRTTFL